LMTVPKVLLSVVKFVKSAVKKWRLFSVVEDLLMPPRLMRRTQTKEAIVSAIGVKMHTARPALPMLARRW
jgi:hypothetical protein